MLAGSGVSVRNKKADFGVKRVNEMEDARAVVFPIVFV